MDFNKKICDVCTYIKWNFKPQISTIFHIEYVNQGVNMLKMSYLFHIVPKLSCSLYVCLNPKFWNLHFHLTNQVVLVKIKNKQESSSLNEKNVKVQNSRLGIFVTMWWVVGSQSTGSVRIARVLGSKTIVLLKELC